MSIFSHTSIDLKKINYTKPEKQGLIYYAPINYNNEPMYLQSPKMICRSEGLEVIEKKNNQVQVETLNMDYSFYDFLCNVDARNIKETFKNNKEWFNKEIPLEVIDDMYKRTCKAVKKDAKPRFTFKIPVAKGKLQCQVYDQKKTCIDVSNITDGCEMSFIFHIKGLKFLKQHYYCDCYISQIKIYLDTNTKFNILEDYAFDDTEEEAQALKELNDDIALDVKIMESLNEENKRKELTEELTKHEQSLSVSQKRVDELYQALNDLG